MELSDWLLPWKVSFHLLPLMVAYDDVRFRADVKCLQDGVRCLSL